MLLLYRIIRLHENGLYKQWKHEVGYAFGVQEEKHPQKAATADAVPLKIKDMAVFFRMYGLFVMVAIAAFCLEISHRFIKALFIRYVGGRRMNFVSNSERDMLRLPERGQSLPEAGSICKWRTHTFHVSQQIKYIRRIRFQRTQNKINK